MASPETRNAYSAVESSVIGQLEVRVHGKTNRHTECGHGQVASSSGARRKAQNIRSYCGKSRRQFLISFIQLASTIAASPPFGRLFFQVDFANGRAAQRHDKLYRQGSLFLLSFCSSVVDFVPAHRSHSTRFPLISEITNMLTVNSVYAAWKTTYVNI